MIGIRIQIGIGKMVERFQPWLLSRVLLSSSPGPLSSAVCFGDSKALSQATVTGKCLDSSPLTGCMTLVKPLHLLLRVLCCNRSSLTSEPAGGQATKGVPCRAQGREH